MASENKVAKLKNSYCVPGMLKNKASELKLKRTAFYTSADRQELNREAEKLLEGEAYAKLIVRERIITRHRFPMDNFNHDAIREDAYKDIKLEDLV